jgi:hypothetical protein
MAGFHFRLELDDGTPASPPVLHTAVPSWQSRRHDPAPVRGTLRVVEIRPDPEGEPVLVVVPTSAPLRAGLGSPDV